MKQALDELELRVDHSGKPLLAGASSKMSTFDKNAVEEAIRLKTTLGGLVTVITLGSSDARKTVKEALAMGGDKGYLLLAEQDVHDSVTTSYLLSRAVEKFGPFDLVLTSEGSSDTYTGQVGPMLSEWLSLPFLGYVRKMVVKEGRVRCEEALEDRVEVLESSLPAVVAVVSEINEPRYPTLIQIMQASKKPIEEVSAGELAEARAPAALVQTLGMSAQSMTRKKVIYEGSPEETTGKLIGALISEGVLKH